MAHVTCLVDGLHRVAEKIRYFKHENNIFESRIDLFKIEAPGISLPPWSILTRWD